MTAHFTPEQFVDALERPLSAERQAHLAMCAACAEQLAGMRRLMGDVSLASTVPEPSPLFWDFLSTRVREAVDAAPAPTVWWTARWQRLAMATGVLGVIVLVMLLRPSSGLRTVAGDPAAADVRRDAAVADVEESDGVWDMIAAVAPPMSVDTAAEAGLRPGPKATHAAIVSLTNAQRQELMKLLRAEMRLSGEHE